MTNGIDAPACWSERSTLSNTGTLSYTFFRQEPTPLTFTVLCSQCLGPTLTFSLVVSAHSFAKGLAPDHPYLPQIRSCVAALACVVFPAKQFAACIDGDTCETHAVFRVVTKAGGSVPSPKNKRHHAYATWARQHGLRAISSPVPLPVCAERAIKLKWPLTRGHCAGFNTINTSGGTRARAHALGHADACVHGCRQALRRASYHGAATSRARGA